MIKRLPILPRGENGALALAAKEQIISSKGENAKLAEKLMGHNSGMIYQILNKYEYILRLRGDYEDAELECMVSFFNAVKTYDGNANFVTYMCECVKNAVLKCLKRRTEIVYDWDSLDASSSANSGGEEYSLMDITEDESVSYLEEKVIVNISRANVIKNLKFFLSESDYNLLLILVKCENPYRHTERFALSRQTLTNHKNNIFNLINEIDDYKDIIDVKRVERYEKLTLKERNEQIR